MDLYFGDVSLCYTNSLAMALDSYGFRFRPEYLEALMVMGNGASVVENDAEHPLVFFDNGHPDASISNCLRILGFEYEDFYVEEAEGPSADGAWGRLQRMLANGPVVAGPLDMGYLTYNPNCRDLGGVDHFVYVCGLHEERVRLHDPAGFPCMEMELEDFARAWAAEGIAYKRGAFSMWGSFTRTREPDAEEIYHGASLVMRKRYEQGESGVMRMYADSIRRNGMSRQQKQIHQFFSFRLAAARSIYMGRFLEEHDPERAELKERIAALFGQAHLNSMEDDSARLADTLASIAELDERFKALCLQYERG